MEVLRLFRSFVQETNYTVWESLVGNLSIINHLFSYTEFHDQFKEYAEALFAPTVARLKWEVQGEDESTLSVFASQNTLNNFVNLPQVHWTPCCAVLL